MSAKNVALTDDMVLMATVGMLVSDCGMRAGDAFALYDRWLRRRKAEVWTEGWEEGQFYEEVYRSGRFEEQSQAKSLSDNPYDIKDES